MCHEGGKEGRVEGVIYHGNKKGERKNDHASFEEGRCDNFA